MSTTGIRIESCGATDVGLLRDHNEDRFLDSPETGIWVVADGMGGHEAGDFAAQMIVDTVGAVGQARSAPDLLARFTDRLGLAHAAIQRQSARLGGATVGATMAALLIHDRDFAVVWSGDSRAYLLRRGSFRQMTTDHSEVQDLLAAGALSIEQAAVWPRRNIITRAIGVSDRPMTETIHGRVVPGDRFLLCSDGLTEHLADAEMAAVLARATPAAACRELIALALSRGGRDNVSVVVLECQRMARAATPGDRRHDGPMPVGG